MDDKLNTSKKIKRFIYEAKIHLGANVNTRNSANIYWVSEYDGEMELCVQSGSKVVRKTFTDPYTVGCIFLKYPECEFFPRSGDE